VLDYIIVGQGVAGSALAWAMRERGRNFVVIDNCHYQASSAVAGGDVNPITGKRFVKTWRIGELLPAIAQMYGAMAQTFGQPVWLPRPIVRVLHNAQQENDWLARAALPEWNGFVGKTTIDLAKICNNVFAAATILQGGKVDMAAMMAHTHQQLLATNSLYEQPFDYTKLQLQTDSVIYTTDNAAQICAKRIIFCEGWQAIHNPFFNYLPFQLSKGEALIIRFLEPYPFADYLVKNDVMIARMPDGNYWVGATNTFEDSSPSPTPEGKQALINRLTAAINLLFEVVSHRACMRPTVLDRRPFLGQHPIHSALYIFNGLGTKGASLAPMLTYHLCDYLDNLCPLDAEVDIARYATHLTPTTH
jgi:glycine oxidase